ncbi:MAG: solute carrier family 12 sodium/potassium/chloride transporter 2 [Thalassolituus oleivorans]|jgi:solute carrier family 12 sodium/potassium/chloride transporter 2
MSNDRGHGFGTSPVFFAGISTILGAIMFLRFGYAVGHVGLGGGLLIIAIGHLVTIPTALALAEIATNRRVEGGGEYYIISRSFGTTIGSVIGVSLYLSQAVSVAFYLIALAEAFTFLGPILESVGLAFDARMVSLPALALLLVLMFTKGADLGVRVLYVVVAILGVSLVAFFAGGPVDGFEPGAIGLVNSVADPDAFIVVFAICFPAFTGMTAGVGLSGDLANPRKSIPLGTLSATLVGMFVYIAIVWKLSVSAPAEMLAGNQMIMDDIAIFGGVVVVGLVAATISSAIGSVLVAPRTLQALGSDRAIPFPGVNGWLSKGTGSANEPRNATIVTGILAFVVILAGNVDIVARLISMFFMITYGSLCAISFLEHFAARPGYRPSFKSRWYISLFGAVMCFLLMFQMDPLFAILALGAMAIMYGIAARRSEDGNDLAAIFEGVMTQLNRAFHLRLQRRSTPTAADEWRPSIITVNEHTFDRKAPLAMMRWMCQRQGFGTYLHYIPGVLNSASFQESEVVRQRLIKLAREQNSPVYMDTVVSPSMTSALAQSLQLPGISGLPNNTVLFSTSVHDDKVSREAVVDSCLFAASTDMTLMVLRHGDKFFGDRKSIHVWLTWNDANNANLMILLAYIMVGHADWSQASIRVFVALPPGEVGEQRSRLEAFMEEGRLPVSEKNIEYLALDTVEDYRTQVAARSADADLTIFGFDLEGLRERRSQLFENHPDLGEVLFIRAPKAVRID